MLPIEKIELLLNKFRSVFTFKSNCEISIEGAPDTFDSTKLNTLKSMGFNRLSIGIQSFNDNELNTMGRNYGAELGYSIAEMAIKSGIDNVNLDLIYGLPNQSFDVWKNNLHKTLILNPKTITIYPLVIRKRTHFGKRQPITLGNQFVEERTRYQWYDYSVEQLLNAGYEQHTMVSFAKKDGGCRYESEGFLGSPTLSFGAGARKYSPTLHYVDDNYRDRKPNKTILLNYMDHIEQGNIPVQSAALLSKSEQMRRFIILGLLSFGINKNRFNEIFYPDNIDSFSKIFKLLEEEALLWQNDSNVFLNAKGIKFSSIIGHCLSSDLIQKNKPLYQ